jgi:hypothetical protein
MGSDPIATRQSASLWLDLHGERAIAEARQMVLAMRAKGDLDGADKWLQIIVALEQMQRDDTARSREAVR